MTEDRKSHWEDVYTTKADDSVSWFEDSPALSVSLITRAAPARGAAIDIGGGGSRMPEALLDLGFTDVACLDLSAAALDVARQRMGEAAGRVRWIVADIAAWQPDRQYDLWHDRAVFHFLTRPEDQAHYAAAVAKGLAPGGIAIIGTFAPDGLERCSGLPVMRHDGHSLSAILGPGFTLLSELRHDHVTPGGMVQKFQFSTFRKD
ncbi:class I SAM-dependent methyltransferase [Altererythrobacter sp. KTW20L]|uniref:class I SAM-dependent methyltransferase n=1 Tax=Altererythrobacter sp. KTW20L TaxID=2942210 RepID=UPI0020BF0B38|nr:class I SAM-dependent methyltransferase [Altererythrobacter sp. KTW20L]MCL6249769.1 class I SAM-dependent methyltransferase [Altererythrobacter sp. KTW20L]